MKKMWPLFLSILSLFSCNDNLEFNTPALQGLKNYELWSSDRFRAGILPGGGLKIIGINELESLTFTLAGFQEGTYFLGQTFNNSAVFENDLFMSFSTSNNGNGSVEIQNYDENNLTITGTFKFNSYSETGELVNFINGVFYEIPIDGNEVDNNVLAGSNYLSAAIDSENKEAIEVVTFINDSQFAIMATNSDGSVLEIFMPHGTGIGSYTLNNASSIYANYIFPDGIVSPSQYGTLIITEHDFQFNKIKASFLFNTSNPYSVSVTSGNFVVYY